MSVAALSTSKLAFDTLTRAVEFQVFYKKWNWDLPEEHFLSKRRTVIRILVRKVEVLFLALVSHGTRLTL